MAGAPRSSRRARSRRRPGPALEEQAIRRPDVQVTCNKAAIVYRGYWLRDRGNGGDVRKYPPVLIPNDEDDNNDDHAGQDLPPRSSLPKIGEEGTRSARQKRTALSQGYGPWHPPPCRLAAPERLQRIESVGLPKGPIAAQFHGAVKLQKVKLR